jgi:hypothetical protein
MKLTGIDGGQLARIEVTMNLERPVWFAGQRP